MKNGLPFGMINDVVPPPATKALEALKKSQERAEKMGHAI